jgi:hypothetical protein
MSGIPSPEDVAVKVLVWLAAPTVLVLAFTSFLAVLGWFSFGRATARYVSVAAANVRSTTVYWTTERQRTFAKLVSAGATFIALAYTLSQLAEVTYHKVGSNISIAEGLSFDWHYLVDQLLDYRHWTPISEWTILAVVGSIALLNVADLAGIRLLRGLLSLVWATTLGLGLLGACLLGLDAVCVLLLGLTHSDNYQPSMTVLYVLWIVPLVALPRLATIIDESSKLVFGQQRYSAMR